MGPGLVNGPFQVEAEGTGRRDAAAPRAARRAAGATASAGGAFEAKLRGGAQPAAPVAGGPGYRAAWLLRGMRTHGAIVLSPRRLRGAPRASAGPATGTTLRSSLRPGRTGIPRQPERAEWAGVEGADAGAGQARRRQAAFGGAQVPCRSLRRSGRFTEVRSRVHSGAGPANFRKAPHGHHGSNGHHSVKY
jgi:hypothetical protein